MKFTVAHGDRLTVSDVVMRCCFGVEKFDKIAGENLRFVLENVSLGLARFAVLRGSIW